MPGAPAWMGDRLLTVADVDDARRLVLDGTPVGPPDVQRGSPAQPRAMEQGSRPGRPFHPQRVRQPIPNHMDGTGRFVAVDNLQHRGETQLSRRSSAIPDHIIRILHRMGHQVEWDRDARCYYVKHLFDSPGEPGPDPAAMITEAEEARRG